MANATGTASSSTSAFLKRKVAVLGLYILAAFFLSACQPSGSESQKQMTAPAINNSTALEGALAIIAWPGYIERGENDSAVDWVTAFERDTGCKVNVKTAGSSDEMLALMHQDDYDLVTASGDASLRLVAASLVQPLQVARIPSFGHIDSRFQSAAWHTVDGKHYGVPYQWGPNVLMYSSAAFKQAPDSWRVLYEAQLLDDGLSNKGRLQAFDSPISIADAALYLKFKQPELGIDDPFALTEHQYQAVINVVRVQHELLQGYWHEANVHIEDFKQGRFVASSAWPFQVNTLRKQGQAVASVIPKEGATGWADSTMLHVRAKHPNCAYAWMEWSLQPKVQGDVAAWFGSLPVVPAACSDNAALGMDGCKTNGMDNFEKIHFWRTPEARCGKAEECVPYSRWTRDYVQIMAD